MTYEWMNILSTKQISMQEDFSKSNINIWCFEITTKFFTVTFLQHFVYGLFIHVFVVLHVHDKRTNEHSVNKRNKYTGRLFQIESLYMVFLKFQQKFVSILRFCNTLFNVYSFMRLSWITLPPNSWQNMTIWRQHYYSL